MPLDVRLTLTATSNETTSTTLFCHVSTESKPEGILGVGGMRSSGVMRVREVGCLHVHLFALMRERGKSWGKGEVQYRSKI